MTEDLSRRAGQPTHEAFWPTDLFTQGIGWVITDWLGHHRSLQVQMKCVSKRVSFGRIDDPVLRQGFLSGREVSAL